MAHAIFTSFTNLIDSNGIPYSSVYVFVLEAGTSTLKTIYSDEALTTPATNPISISSGGPHDMRYVASGTYKIVVETGGTSTLGSGTQVTKYCKDNIDTGVAVGSGNLAVASGGTGSGTAAGARTNLGAASSTSVSDIAVDVATLQDSLTGTDATQLALGTTAQRPVTPAEGQIRGNSTTSKFEGYIGAAWVDVKSSADSSSTTNIKAETAEDTYIRPDRLIASERVARAWASISFPAGTPTLDDGFNVSSTILDNGVGDITISFTTALVNANYAAVATARTAIGTNHVVTVVSPNTTTLRLQVLVASTATAADPVNLYIVVFGSSA